MTNNKNDIFKLLEFGINNFLSEVQCIYEGDDRSCRCGCRGQYYRTIMSDIHPNSILNTAKCIELLDRFVELRKSDTTSQTHLTIGEHFLDLSYGHNKSICIYFK